MKCPSCGHENREGRKFCSECASILEVRCPSCHALNEPGEKFCGDCVAPLSGDTGTPKGAGMNPAHGRGPAAPEGTARRGAPADPRPTPVGALLAAPTSFANGRYEVKKFLGEGGKKKVYLAHDTLLDRDVAFALIKTDALDEASRSRITREARAMGRLGDHGHIMPIYDLGQEKGQPFMVLPLMGGGDVEGLITMAPEHRMPLEQAIDIAKSVCLGLQFAHRSEERRVGKECRL